MKKSLFFIALFAAAVNYAQVGIDTESPEQQLHISGTVDDSDTSGVVKPTIRIDGLQEANNSNYVSGEQVQPVYVNANGDLMLRPNSSSFGYLVGDNLKNDDLGSIVVAYAGTSTNTTVDQEREILQEMTLTLDSKSLVHFNHSISLNIVKDATTPLSDGIPRIVQVYFRVISSPSGVAAGRIIAPDGVYYTSHDATSASGYVPTNGYETMILPAGIYNIRLEGVLTANPSITNGEQSFMVEFGGWVQDEISVIAEPWPY